MAWRDQLQPASFRQVPFFVESNEMQGGRKTVVFSYPGRDDVFVEDMGRRPRTHEIEAYVIGPDYFSARDALIAALEGKGPGTLVHPTLGTKDVAVERFRMKESKHEGGFAAFGIDLIETVDRPFAPSASVAQGSLLQASSARSLVAVQNRFLNRYTTHFPSGLSVPSWSLNSAAQVLTDWTHTLRTALLPIIHDTQKLATMKAQLDQILHAATTLVRTPISVATNLGLAIQSLVNWPDTPRLGIGALLAAYNFTPSIGRPDARTRTRGIEQRNYDTLSTFVRSIGIVQAVQLAGAATTLPGRTVTTALSGIEVDAPAGYDSYQDAIGVRDTLTAAIDVIAADADDDTFATLQQLRADLSASVPGVPNTLPDLRPLTPPATVPALVLAYRLYGDIALADDVVTRNRVAHPGFVAGGQPLQVLSHA